MQPQASLKEDYPLHRKDPLGNDVIDCKNPLGGQVKKSVDMNLESVLEHHLGFTTTKHKRAYIGSNAWGYHTRHIKPI